jgi:hypothetical protein
LRSEVPQDIWLDVLFIREEQAEAKSGLAANRRVKISLA